MLVSKHKRTNAYGYSFISQTKNCMVVKNSIQSIRNDMYYATEEKGH